MKAWILQVFLYALPLALRNLYLPQSPRNLLIPLFKKIAEEENRGHAQILHFPAFILLFYMLYNTLFLQSLFLMYFLPM